MPATAHCVSVLSYPAVYLQAGAHAHNKQHAAAMLLRLHCILCITPGLMCYVMQAGASSQQNGNGAVADLAAFGPSRGHIRTMHSNGAANSADDHAVSTVADSSAAAASPAPGNYASDQTAQIHDDQAETESLSSVSTAAVDEDDASGSDDDQVLEAEAHWSSYTSPQVVDIRYAMQHDIHVQAMSTAILAIGF